MARLMTERHMTQTDLARDTGIGRASICQYLSGTCKPTAKNRQKLADALAVTVAQLDPSAEQRDAVTAGTATIYRMSVRAAARVMRVSEETIRKGIQQNIFPWGYAVKTSDKEFTYIINGKKLLETELIDSSVAGSP